MKRVNQFERTDRDITNALLKVMEKKSLEKISVQDILDEAMVNRSTFYQHFSDKYAILERLQEKYVSDMTERIDEMEKSGEWSMEKVNASLCDYLAQNRSQMRKLLSVRSEALDLQEQMKHLFAAYLGRANARLTDLERDILSGMMVSFFVYFLNNTIDGTELSARMLDTWLNMTVYFFRVDRVADARDQLLALIEQMHREQA